MKCPKCGYLGFEDVDRCRNCGYEFSLLPTPGLADLSLRPSDDQLLPLDDLALVDAAARPAPPSTSTDDVPFDAPVHTSSSRLPSSELPLFWSGSAAEAPRRDGPGDDAPLIAKPSPPRPPLAVRRASPEVPRIRSSSQMRTPMLDLNAFDSEPVSSTTPSDVKGARPQPRSIEASEAAGLPARAGAALFDVVVLFAIDAVVVYLTMQICGVTWDEINLLPKMPLVAFLVAQNLGYFIGLTIGGQTLGKMLTGIRVVSVDDHGLGFGHSLLRTLVWCLLALPAGLGFLTALLGPDGRGLHDRFAGTRVIRA